MANRLLLVVGTTLLTRVSSSNCDGSHVASNNSCEEAAEAEALRAEGVAMLQVKAPRTSAARSIENVVGANATRGLSSADWSQAVKDVLNTPGVLEQLNQKILDAIPDDKIAIQSDTEANGNHRAALCSVDWNAHIHTREVNELKSPGHPQIDHVSDVDGDMLGDVSDPTTLSGTFTLTTQNHADLNTYTEIDIWLVRGCGLNFDGKGNARVPVHVDFDLSASASAKGCKPLDGSYGISIFIHGFKISVKSAHLHDAQVDVNLDPLVNRPVENSAAEEINKKDISDSVETALQGVLNDLNIDLLNQCLKIA